MTRKDLGPTPVGVKDGATLGWVRTTYPSYSNYVASPQDLNLVLPANPAEHQMELFEVKASGNQILVFMPSQARLTLGSSRGVTVQANKTAFFGFRYSSHAQAWFLLSATFES